MGGAVAPSFSLNLGLLKLTNRNPDYYKLIISMSLLNQYIQKRFFGLFATIFFILLGILWLSRIVKHLSYITKYDINVSDFILISVWIIPRIIDSILPIATLVTTIFVINSLIYSKEIFIIKSAGLAQRQILKPLFYCSIVIFLINFVFLFFASPYAYRKFDQIKKDVATQIIGSVTKTEKFNKISKTGTLYIKSKNKNILQDIIIYDKIKQNEYFIFAKKGEVFNNDNEVFIKLYQGNRQVVSNGKIISDLSFQQYQTNLDSLFKKKIYKNKQKIGHFYLQNFFLMTSKQIAYFDNNEASTEFHHRIIWSLMNIMLLLIIFAILAKNKYDRNGNIKFNLIAIILSLSFIIGYFIIKTIFLTKFALVLIPYIYIMSPLMIAFLIFLILPLNNEQKISSNR